MPWHRLADPLWTVCRAPESAGGGYSAGGGFSVGGQQIGGTAGETGSASIGGGFHQAPGGEPAPPPGQPSMGSGPAAPSVDDEAVSLKISLLRSERDALEAMAATRSTTASQLLREAFATMRFLETERGRGATLLLRGPTGELYEVDP